MTISIIITFSATFRLICDLIQLWVVEETGVPAENHHLSSSHWELFHMPYLDFCT